MKAGRVYRRWAKQGVRLSRRLQELATFCVEEGTPQQVHDLRVVLRRYRFWAKVGKVCLNKKSRRRLDDWGRQVASWTGPVRDLDVAAEWFRARRAGGVARATLEERRTTAWETCRTAWQPLSPEVFAGLRPTVDSREAARQLRRRVRRMEQRFEDQLAGTLARFFKLDPETRHEVRRAVRRWRYLREMLLTRRERSEDSLLRALLAVQTAVGDTQNLELAAALVDESAPENALRKRLRQTAATVRKAQLRQTKQALRELRQALD